MDNWWFSTSTKQFYRGFSRLFMGFICVTSQNVKDYGNKIHENINMINIYIKLHNKGSVFEFVFNKLQKTFLLSVIIVINIIYNYITIYVIHQIIN